ncbi:hypothetical protein GCM10010121_085480 [Streptomyces brasiliensis]|uniref:Uncharacterized protein n=1 Tax=Streptomyces brasiliensis TaxID=1954 RepID=A0A917UJU8_9ACTN|nr:hypothetical protein GCM10010121_085480 [Streptomyces brasiliensis]
MFGTAAGEAGSATDDVFCDVLSGSACGSNPLPTGSFGTADALPPADEGGAGGVKGAPGAGVGAGGVKGAPGAGCGGGGVNGAPGVTFPAC